MKFLEELSMNAFPSLQTVLYDGWVLRFAGGYSNRANSVNPIYVSTENINTKLDCCESFYKRMNLKTVYKITPFVYPENIDGLLEQRGYKKIHQTSLQTMSLSDLEDPKLQTAVVYSDLNDKWYEYYCSSKNLNTEDKATLRKMLESIIPFKFYVLLSTGSETVACGMAVLESGYAGLFDIFVDERYRNRGYGKQLLLNILKTAKANGAEKAYIQVMKDNYPAVHLYGKLGFREVYRYWYRVSE